ncbi:alpha/beta hydrolase [Nocardia macrotermitis]|uniref:alpha/beta hydrolase n=1 Tax=Nocardia macrotermitis TaxID=2585198 RepID=UPI001297D04F|nr:alpha/beta hydrolase-fold protein [Nocardia macrotermitis]
MSLTGDALFYTVVVTAVVAVGVTLVGWNRLRGPRAVRWLTRLSMIVCCQCAAVVSVAVWVNDANGLYTSWDDLLGRTRMPTVTAADATEEPPVTFEKAGDRLVETDYQGPESGLDGEVLVWTPPQYDQAAYRDHRFPVIMLLHGVPGSPLAWIRGGRAPELLGALMRDGTLPPAILVMPRINPGSNTDCVNVPGGAQTATWLAHDVPRMISSQFRVRADAKGWALAGDSTGGYCAAKLPLQYPKVFATGLALSPDDFHGDPAIIDDPALRAANDPTQLAARGIPVSLMVVTSSSDPSSSPANARALFDAARAPTRVAAPLILPEGGHNWGTWQATYPTVFGWVGTHLRPPSDGPLMKQATAVTHENTTYVCPPDQRCAGTR